MRYYLCTEITDCAYPGFSRVVFKAGPWYNDLASLLGDCMPGPICGLTIETAAANKYVVGMRYVHGGWQLA